MGRTKDKKKHLQNIILFRSQFLERATITIEITSDNNNLQLFALFAKEVAMHSRKLSYDFRPICKFATYLRLGNLAITVANGGLGSCFGFHIDCPTYSRIVRSRSDNCHTEL